MKLRFIRTPYRVVLLCSAALIQALTMPVFAQGTASEFAALLRGTRAPETIKASELTKDWSRFKSTSPSVNLRAQKTQNTLGDMIPYYSRGELVMAGSESFLIAYRQSTPGPVAANVDFDIRLKPDEVLTLSLLNLHSVGTLHEIRAFDPSRDMLHEGEGMSQAPADARKASVSNLKQIGLGLAMYVQDYDEVYPPTRSVQSKAEITAPIGKLAAVQQVLRPYVKSVDLFSHPATHELYQPNPALSGVYESSISDRVHVVAFWEKSPMSDGTRAVLYLNGHVAREPEANWPAILARSNKILPPHIRKTAPPGAPHDTPGMAARRVKIALNADAALKGLTLNIGAYDGTLLLDGTVHSAAQKTRVAATAKKAAPNYRIVNRLNSR